MLFHCLSTDDAFQTECQLDWFIFLAGECHSHSRQSWKYLPSTHTHTHSANVTLHHNWALCSTLFIIRNYLFLLLPKHQVERKHFPFTECSWLAVTQKWPDLCPYHTDTLGWLNDLPSVIQSLFQVWELSDWSVIFRCLQPKQILISGIIFEN